MMPGPSPIKLRAMDVARSVITGIYGPRPAIVVGPAGEGPTTPDGVTKDQFLSILGSQAAGRKWDRRVAALANALASEARRIEDRGVMRRMPAPVRVGRGDAAVRANVA